MNDELNKLLDFWADYPYLNEEEWNVFKEQMDNIVNNGQTYEQVAPLADDLEQDQE